MYSDLREMIKWIICIKIYIEKVKRMLCIIWCLCIYYYSIQCLGEGKCLSLDLSIMFYSKVKCCRFQFFFNKLLIKVFNFCRWRYDDMNYDASEIFLNTNFKLRAHSYIGLMFNKCTYLAIVFSPHLQFTVISQRFTIFISEDFVTVLI